jgi:hypothetical protein
VSNVEIMNKVTDELDGFFNPGVAREDRQTGLVLIVYPFSAGQGQVHIGTNGADEEEVVMIMRKMVEHYDQRQVTDTSTTGEIMQ